MTTNTVTTKTVESFKSGLGGARFAQLFAILEENGLRPLGKSNTGTLLFQAIDNDGTMHDVLAFRREPVSVLSFPKSYWLPRKELRSSLCGAFEPHEQPAVIPGVGSNANESAGQVTINKNTLERVKELCVEVCNRVISTHG